MSDLRNINGLADLERFMDQLPPKLARNVLRGGLRAGANVLRAAAKAKVSVGMPSAEAAGYGAHLGSMRDSIRVSTSVKGGRVTAKVIAGSKEAYYGLWLEFGTRPHVIEVSTKGGLTVGGRVVASVNHPGARPHPFMRPALDQSASAAVIAAAEYMKDRLSTKYGLDTADIDIGEGA